MKSLLSCMSCCTLLIFLTGCNTKDDPDAILLGDYRQEKIWIYLSGLTMEFDSDQELLNRKILHRVGLATKTKFMTIRPTERCHYFYNKLCWKANNPLLLEITYKKIMSKVNKKELAGFIGFSNGGFFLNQLAMTQELGVPIISIGSAGPMKPSPYKNNIYLFIGRKDAYHYDHVIEWLKLSKRFTNLNIKLIEHEGGHEIPEYSLLTIFNRLRSNE